MLETVHERAPDIQMGLTSWRTPDREALIIRGPLTIGRVPNSQRGPGTQKGPDDQRVPDIQRAPGS